MTHVEDDPKRARYRVERQASNDVCNREHIGRKGAKHLIRNCQSKANAQTIFGAMFRLRFVTTDETGAHDYTFEGKQSRHWVEAGGLTPKKVNGFC